MIVDSPARRLGGTGGGGVVTFVATRPATFRAMFQFSEFRDGGFNGFSGSLVGRACDPLSDEFFNGSVIYRNKQ